MVGRAAGKEALGIGFVNKMHLCQGNDWLTPFYLFVCFV